MERRNIGKHSEGTFTNKQTGGVSVVKRAGGGDSGGGRGGGGDPRSTLHLRLFLETAHHEQLSVNGVSESRVKRNIFLFALQRHLVAAARLAQQR